MSLANGDLGGTTGTKFDPLLVEDALDLIALQNLHLMFPDRNPQNEPYYVKQVGDIDMTGFSWDSQMYGFMYYNGRMHKISNLTLDGVVFFGYTTYEVCGINFDNFYFKNRGVLIPSDVVENRQIKNITMSGTVESNSPPVGEVLYGTVFENIHIEVNAINRSELSGGIADEFSDCIAKNCSVKVTLDNLSTVFGGGFVGRVNGGRIERCSSEVVGVLRGSGFIGRLDESYDDSDLKTPKIYDCYSTATIVDGAYGYSAGFVGISGKRAEIKDCYCSGTIADGVQMTGFAGLPVSIWDVEGECIERYSDIIIENCYSLIESITRDDFQGPNQIYRFSPCSHINNSNYVSSSMQFVDHFDPPEDMPPEYWYVPFDEGIEVSGVTIPEHEYPVGFCPDPVPVHKCKTFYLN